MLPFFAQLTDASPPSGFSQFIANAFYTVALLTSLIVAWRHMRTPTPSEHKIAGQPVEVKPAKEYATKQELQALEGRVAGLDNKLDEHFRTLTKERSTSIAGLHKRIETETEDLRLEMKEDTRGIHARINDAFNKLSELIGEMKGLHK